MMFRSIRWRIVVPYVILVLVVMLGLAIYVSNLMRGSFLDDLGDQLLAEARLLADQLRATCVDDADIFSCSEQDIDALAKHWAELLGVRVTVIGFDGTVLGESDEDRTQMDNHLFRPEVQQALDAGQGSSIRFSRTVGYEMIYVALAMSSEEGGQTGDIVRVAVPLRQIEASVGRLRQAVLMAALVVALVATLLALLIAERTVQPVRRLTRAAERLAEGNLGGRLFPTTQDEIGQLTHAFNHMAEQLRDKVANLAEERGRLAAVLENMADGVLITDSLGQVQLINPAAAWLLGTNKERALGYSFAQVVRHHHLIELMERCRAQEEDQVEAVEFSHRGLFLQAIVTPFWEADARGYLVILQDLTRIRRLETVRRDFISNISHELRTPLAGLKALVDTLRDGALEDPPAALRFLNHMDAEVDILTQMVQELLELSRLESGKAPMRLVPTSISNVMLPPLERLRPQAERAELELTSSLPPQLPMVLADAERVQLAITNLLHNAIKFTPAGGHVAVSAEAVDGEVLIAVSDTGVGIPAEDLPRIFERFYKADRARTGGGTGLGLAIAKHIVQGHGGRIWVESVEREGSTFYFSLPAVD